MVIECGEKDLRSICVWLKRGGDAVELSDSNPVQKLVLRSAIDCVKSAANPDGKAMLEVKGTKATETVTQGGVESEVVIPGLYVFLLDMQNVGGAATEVIPGRYGFEFQVVTMQNDGVTEYHHKTLAYNDENTLVIHKEAAL